MPPRLSIATLLDISKRDAKALKHIGLGIHLSSSAGLTINQLVENAAKDRMKLAAQILKSARMALDPNPVYRACLARSYYAMYHATRSVVFYIERGDDHEAHSELPKHFPRDFPDITRWENDLKSARLERNRADYDPYPKADSAFAKSAKTVLANAETFIPVAKRYLRRKGCQI
jgi:uncharacterized protein (UPF0332 family)